MKSAVLLISLVLVLSQSLPAAEDIHVKTSWDINPSHHTYKNHDTKVSLGSRIAAFRLYEAEPARSDGSAKFVYHGERGFITLYQEFAAVLGSGTPGDYVHASCSAMEKGNGKFDSKSFFSLRYDSGEKRALGRGVVYHFIKSPEADGKQIWDEFGAVRIGEFFFPIEAALSRREVWMIWLPFYGRLVYERSNQALERTAAESDLCSN
jgi:hypothetical protein